MTHVIYSHQQLQLKSIAGLKQIYSDIGCTVEITKRYSKNAWINAIAQHQARHIYKAGEQGAGRQGENLSPLPPAPSTLASSPDEQAQAQAELENYIAQQAEEIAPEELTTQEINPHHFEVYAGKRLIAYISYDHEHVTQPWVVMVSGEEKFRHNTLSQCHRFINWHHLDGTLNPLSPAEVPEAPTVQEISFYDQEVVVEGEPIASVEFDDHNYQNLYWRVMVNGQEIFCDTTPARCHSYVKQAYQQGMLPVQEEDEEQFSPLHPTPCPVSSSENRIMVHIFNECQKYGFEILDDGIYKDGIKLGQVGCTNGNWWVIQGCSGEAQYSYSVFDAVRSLGTSFEDQLDAPFDQLSSHEWLLPMETETQSRALVAV
ncbi:hypothetical protein [Nostoc sp. MS1]|uniref:hypothetical protein n=1 Tax=Nostoc sp. MS1 TaxID=2764711 RepID=UPI001CC5A145|nr:hypothetical protein [Nostoc sp. MS1]BCL39673.1 hypothetical protein NSMS1_61200 [Nostoc sp. MS1]